MQGPTTATRRMPLTLPPVPASVPASRAFVREALAGLGPDLVDSAELCMSELVTNGVLHARTDMEIRVEVLGERVRLEIRDHSTAVPRHIIHSANATTGRGLDLVRTLADEWGVLLVEDDGKVVWCELTATTEHVELGEDALLAAWPDDDPTAKARSVPPTGWGHLLNYPVERGLRYREHHDAILRECLLVAQGGSDGAGSAPSPLVELAMLISSRYSTLHAEPERRKVAAHLRGEATVDLDYPLPPDAPGTMRALLVAFRALDVYAAQNSLLTLQTPPDLLELRKWIITELLAQAEGAAPTPWPGPVD